MCKIYTKAKSEPLEKRLKTFLDENELLISNETDIVSLCKKLGLSSIYMPLDDIGLAGFLLVNKNHKTIAINDKLEPLDARFLIAHELAHYITESKGQNESELLIATKDLLNHNEDKPTNEHDMDYMAAAILVPKEQFMWELFALKVNLKDIESYTEKEVRKKVSPNILGYLARRYRVREDLIVRRIIEVSYYA